MPSLRDRGRQLADELGVDWDWLDRLINQESGWQHYDQRGRILTSEGGALGVSQLMPPTARELGVNPYDPISNLRGGITYLKQMFDRYSGDPVRAIVAYNAGQGRIDKWNRTREYFRRPENRSWGREAEKYLDSVVGPGWESMPSVGPVIGLPPQPGTGWIPSFPTPASIGEGIWTGFTGGIGRFVANRSIETWSGPLMLGAGSLLVAAGLITISVRSPGGKATVTYVREGVGTLASAGTGGAATARGAVRMATR